MGCARKILSEVWRNIPGNVEGSWSSPIFLQSWRHRFGKWISWSIWVIFVSFWNADSSQFWKPLEFRRGRTHFGMKYEEVNIGAPKTEIRECYSINFKKRQNMTIWAEPPSLSLTCTSSVLNMVLGTYQAMQNTYWDMSWKILTAKKSPVI